MGPSTVFRHATAWALRCGCALLVWAIAVGPAQSATAPAGSMSRAVPSQAYFNTLGIFYGGDYKEALEGFLSEGGGGIKTVYSRWIDSICYATMAGECYYHMGDLNKALEYYNAALKLYVTYSQWMIRVQFPASIRPAGAGALKRVPWGVSARRAPLGDFRSTMLIAQGQIDNNAVVQQGGVMQPPSLFPIRVEEIVRCTALAIRRRAALLGPVSRYDALTNDVLNALMRRPGPPNHWSEAWVDLPLGLALVAAGKDSQALQPLQRSLLAGGQFDHPLTSTGLLSLGMLAMSQGNFQVAANHFAETTYAAVNYRDPGVLEEAFYYGTLCHLMANQRGLYPPLLPAIDWAKREGLYHLLASLQLLAAENYVALGQPQDAARLLADAKRSIGHRSMGLGRIGARLNYQNAAVCYQLRRLTDGDAALSPAMRYMQNGSYWLFHIRAVDRLYADGNFTARQAVDLYQKVLRDPQPMDWAMDPMESLSVLVTPHLSVYERWFKAALERRDHDAAVEIGDRMRRHRFFSSLALGGRLHSLRWLLCAPERLLSPQAQLNRHDLLARYPLFEKLNNQAQELREKLRQQPLVAETPEAQHVQQQLLNQWGSISAQQEGMLREIALRHEAAEMVFPPVRSTQEIQKSLPPGHVLLTFVCVHENLRETVRENIYAFLFSSQRYTYWQINSVPALHKRIGEMLRDMGHFDQGHDLTVKDLAGAQWKTSARDVLHLLQEGSQAEFADPFDELIIVPDGMLWYVPFEALQVEVDKKLQPLIARFRIRYVPTASLAVPDGRGRRPGGSTGVVVGPLLGRESEATSRAAYAQLAKVLPGTAALPVPLPASSSLYASLFDRLVVLAATTPNDAGPYAWAPVPIDRAKPGSALDDWMTLPWGGPDEMIFAGYHTAAENAMKRITPAAAGDEMFLSVCGLMASGARTILLSRWLTGGQTACDLAREFAQELPHTFPADAWQRSVFLCNEATLNLEQEPRVKRTANDTAPKAAHPFFWSAYMLIDSAGAAKEDADAGPKDQPAPKVAPPEQPKPPPVEERPAPKVRTPKRKSNSR